MHRTQMKKQDVKLKQSKSERQQYTLQIYLVVYLLKFYYSYRQVRSLWDELLLIVTILDLFSQGICI